MSPNSSYQLECTNWMICKETYRFYSSSSEHGTYLKRRSGQNYRFNPANVMISPIFSSYFFYPDTKFAQFVFYYRQRYRWFQTIASQSGNVGIVEDTWSRMKWCMTDPPVVTINRTSCHWACPWCCPATLSRRGQAIEMIRTFPWNIQNSFRGIFNIISSRDSK